jgi:hypothetical protein
LRANGLIISNDSGNRTGMPLSALLRSRNAFVTANLSKTAGNGRSLRSSETKKSSQWIGTIRSGRVASTTCRQ